MKTMCSKVYRLKFTSNLKTNGHLLSKTPGADQFLIPQTLMIFTKVYNPNRFNIRNGKLCTCRKYELSLNHKVHQS